MTNVTTARKSVLATLTLGVVLFSFVGLDSTLEPTNFAATTVTQTTAQA